MGGFTSSKAILDIIKAQAAGKRAEIDLQQALQLQSAEGQLAAEEAKQKQAEEQQKARQQQQKGQGKQQATPPDFVQLDAASAGRSTAPQSNLDNATQAVGGGGAQQFLQQLQGARGGGGTQAPGAGIPSQAQALGQPQQQGNVPSRLNSVGFQSSTGGGSLAEALGQPRNTINFQSDPNALTPFQQGSLGIAQQRNNIAAAGERAQLFATIFSTIPGISPAQAQAGARAIFDDDETGVVNAFRGSEEKLRELYKFQLDRASLENDKLTAEIGFLNARSLSEVGLIGDGGEMTIPQILGLPGRSNKPLDDNNLQLRAKELFVLNQATKARSNVLQGDAEVLAPGIQTAFLARDRALLLAPKGGAFSVGPFLASIGFGSDAAFGVLPVQKILTALATIRREGVSATEFAKAEKFLTSSYYAKNEAGEIDLDANNQPVSIVNINETVGDAILILSDMMTSLNRDTQERLGRDATLQEFRQMQTLLRLHGMVGSELGGQLGRATQ